MSPSPAVVLDLIVTLLAFVGAVVSVGLLLAACICLHSPMPPEGD